MSTRVYLPSSLGQLREVVVSGGVGPVPLLGHCVTDALRRSDPDGDEEEWEYAALTAAAQDSLALLEDDAPRRVVVVADVETVLPVSGAAEPSLVEVVDVIPLRVVAAVHVDAPEAAEAVAAAHEAWPAAQAGDEAAVGLVESCLDHELAWFATQEVGGLLEP